MQHVRRSLRGMPARGAPSGVTWQVEAELQLARQRAYEAQQKEIAHMEVIGRPWLRHCELSLTDRHSWTGFTMKNALPRR